MGNILKIKHGNQKPVKTTTKKDLSSYELGYSTSDKKLYINDENISNEMVRLGGTNMYKVSLNFKLLSAGFKENTGEYSSNYPYYYILCETNASGLVRPEENTLLQQLSKIYSFADGMPIVFFDQNSFLPEGSVTTDYTNNKIRLFFSDPVESGKEPTLKQIAFIPSEEFF